MKIENINDIFSNSTVCGQCKKSGMKLFENVSKRRGLCQTFFSKYSTAQLAKHLGVVTKSVQMETLILI